MDPEKNKLMNGVKNTASESFSNGRFTRFIYYCHSAQITASASERGADRTGRKVACVELKLPHFRPRAICARMKISTPAFRMAEHQIAIGELRHQVNSEQAKVIELRGMTVCPCVSPFSGGARRLCRAGPVSGVCGRCGLHVNAGVANRTGLLVM